MHAHVFACWKSFKKSLIEKINLSVPLSKEQVEKEVETFLNNNQRAAWENTPEIRRRTKKKMATN